jgi:hypothetical protein
LFLLRYAEAAFSEREQVLAPGVIGKADIEIFGHHPAPAAAAIRILLVERHDPWFPLRHEMPV